MQRETFMQSILKYDAFESITIHTGNQKNAQGLIQQKLLKIDCTKLRNAHFVLAE